MTQSENRCIFCDRLHTEGIRLRGKFICTKCEEELLKLQVDDEPAYSTFKDGLKVIWTGQIPQERDVPGSIEPDHQGSDRV